MIYSIRVRELPQSWNQFDNGSMADDTKPKANTRNTTVAAFVDMLPFPRADWHNP
jgi:hypothetical protein